MTELDERPDEHGVVITEFDGCTVAHLPENGEAWISGWVDVPQ